jgi:hypothetical protein
MTDFNPQADPHAAPEAHGHEPSEVGIRAIFVFGAVLVALTAVSMAVLGLLMGQFSQAEKADGTSTKQLIEEKPGDFPTPRLQRNTTYDMVEYREAEEAALKSYGWADAKAGIAQIPIDAAIDYYSKHDLPRPKAQPAAPAESKPPTESKKPETRPAAGEPGKKE